MSPEDDDWEIEEYVSDFVDIDIDTIDPSEILTNENNSYNMDLKWEK